MLPLRGPCGFRTIPVTRFLVGNNPGLDIPMLTDVWSVDGMTDERTIPVARTGGRSGRTWEVYSIWFLRPHDRDAPANRAVQLLGDTPPITGEFVIFRRTPDGYRLLDIRRIDHIRVEAAVYR